MSELSPPTNPTAPAVPFLRVALIITAIVIFAGSCIIAGVTLTDASQHGQPSPQTAVLAFGIVLAGLILAAGLCALSAIIALLASAAARLETPADDLRPAVERIEQSLRVLNTQ